MIAEREQNRPAAVEEERVMEAINARRGKKEKRKLQRTQRVVQPPPGRLHRIQRGVQLPQGVCAEYRVWQENGAVEVGCA